MARGHIRKRGKGYAVVLELPKDPVTGKRRQKWLAAPNKKTAETILAEELAKIHRGQWAPVSTSPLSEYLARWLETVQSQREPATYTNYESAVRLHIAPVIGSVPLAKLTPLMVQTFYEQLRVNGLGAPRRNQIHRILHRAMEQALRWRLIASNPCDAVDPPTRSQPDVSFWDRATVDRFLRLTTDDPFGPYWAIAILTGLRRGELTGLRWRDINLERGMLRVEQQTKLVDGVWQLGKLKTSYGRRSVPLTVQAVSALHEQRRRQNVRRLQLGSNWHDLDLVFDHYDGRPWSGSALSAVFYRRLRALDGIPPVRLHDLRHTAASLMLAAGLSLFEVSRILGHSSISITADLYGHLAQDTLDIAKSRLDAASSG